MRAARELHTRNRKNWRRRDESDMRACRIGNLEGTGPTLVKPKKNARRTRPQSVEVRINTAHNWWRRILQLQVAKFFSSFFEKDTEIT
jgi:hypothetical protein